MDNWIYPTMQVDFSKSTAAPTLDITKGMTGTLAQIVVQNVLDEIAASNGDLDEAKVLRDAKLNPSFFSNRRDKPTMDMYVGNIERLAGALKVPTLSLLLPPSKRQLFGELLRILDTLPTDRAGRLEAETMDLARDELRKSGLGSDRA